MYAKQVDILLGAIEVKAFQLPDGSYALSQESCCSVIEKPRNSFKRVADGKSQYAEALTRALRSTQSVNIEGSKARISAVSLEAAVTYWSYWADKGHVPAKALLSACTLEALTRRIDAALGIEKTEEERNVSLEEARQFWEGLYKQALDNAAWGYEMAVSDIKDNDYLTPAERRRLLKEQKEAYQQQLISIAADHVPVIQSYR